MNNKKYIILFCAIITLSLSKGIAQDIVYPMGFRDYSVRHQMNVGSGKIKPTDPSAYFEIGPSSGATKGILFPRGNKNDIITPTNGLIIFDIPSGKLWIYHNGWELLGATTIEAGTPSDTLLFATKWYRHKGDDSLAALIDLRVKYTDTAGMLFPYARKIELPYKVNVADTAAMLQPYMKYIDTLILVTVSDTAAMLEPYAYKVDTLKWNPPLYRNPYTGEVYINVDAPLFNARKIMGRNIETGAPQDGEGIKWDAASQQFIYDPFDAGNISMGSVFGMQIRIRDLFYLTLLTMWGIYHHRQRKLKPLA